MAVVPVPASYTDAWRRRAAVEPFDLAEYRRRNMAHPMPGVRPEFDALMAAAVSGCNVNDISGNVRDAGGRVSPLPAEPRTAAPKFSVARCRASLTSEASIVRTRLAASLHSLASRLDATSAPLRPEDLTYHIAVERRLRDISVMQVASPEGRPLTRAMGTTSATEEATPIG